VTERRHPRYDLFGKVYWDFFASGSGRKKGYLANLSQSGCLLKTSDPIDMRRWIRLLYEDPSSNLCVTLIGRVLRRNNQLETIQEGLDFTLYQHGVEFTFPNHFSLAATDLILDLSRRNLRVSSCLNLNSKSSLRPGFLA